MTSTEEQFASALDAFGRDAFEDADILCDGIVARAYEGVSVSRVNAPAAPRVSVVVVSYKTTEKYLSGMRALAAAARQLPDYEFVFVSNAHADAAAVVAENFPAHVLVEVGFNFGCSGARNVGALVAKGDLLVFIDDDGLTTAGDIRALVEGMSDGEVVAVRGWAEPFPGQTTPPHYRPTEFPIPRYIDLEGMSVWRRGVFNEVGGFNVLLAGHEGVELTCRLLPHHGYNAFRYDPAPRLQHDFAVDTSGLEAKAEKQKRSRRYLAHRGVDLDKVVKAFAEARTRLFENAVFITSTRPQVASNTPAVSACFLTTVKNGAAFAETHRRSLVGQTDGAFSLIVVDDHSTDGSFEEIERVWRGDSRLTLIRNEGVGRSAALNTGLRSCSSDIVLIADVDDISLPKRLFATKRAFADNPDLDLLGFLIFTTERYVRLGAPASTSVSSLDVRRLFGMPAPFPAFAARRNRIVGAFNEDLVAGVDYDWVSLQIEAGLRGRLFFDPMVYYHTHPGQITSVHSEKQRHVGESRIMSAYEAVLGGSLSDSDRDAALMLAGWKRGHGRADSEAMAELACRLLHVNAKDGVLPQDQLEVALAIRMAEQKGAPAPAPKSRPRPRAPVKAPRKSAIERASRWARSLVRSK